MAENMSLLSGLGWPLMLALAWAAGEYGYRLTGLPRISLYGLVGFIVANLFPALLPAEDSMELLANIAFGLILFELGYRINLRWLRNNPWLGAASLTESLLTFLAVLYVAQAFDMDFIPALLLSSLAMASSPAAIMCVVNEERSSGQVTERILHLSAFNCVLAVFTFKLVVGLWVFHTTGDILHALWNSLVFLVYSIALGALFGVLVPMLLQHLSSGQRDATVLFAIAVVILASLSHALKFSPVLAVLAFGLIARHRRVALSQAEKDFGVLGHLLTVLLFVFMASTLHWAAVWSGLGLAVALVLVRSAVKTLSVTGFSYLGGITWRKGVLTGVALTPLSAFAILLLEQTRQLDIGLVDELAALAAMTLLLEVIGPVATHWALVRAKEVRDTGRD